jgi:low affinity Fe/Cu permease
LLEQTPGGIFEVHNSFVGLEHLTEEELKDIRGRCLARAKGEIAAVNAKGRAEGKRPAAIEYAGTTG